MLGQQLNEFRKLGHLCDIGDIPQIPRQNGREIRPQPVLSPPLVVSPDRLGEAAEQDEPHKVIADDRAGLVLQLSLEEALQKARRLAVDFGPRQGKHLDGLDPARQAVGDTGQGHDVGGAGEKKSPRPIILINGLLHREQELGNALDLVDDRQIEPPDEPTRIGLRGFEGRLIIQRDVATPGLRQISRKGRLSRPSGSDDQHHRGVRKGLLHPPLRKPRVHDAPEPPIIRSLGTR